MSNPFEAPPGKPARPESERAIPDLPHPKPYTPEELAAAKARADADYIEPEKLEVSETENEARIREATELIDAFEMKHSLEALHAITAIPLAELGSHPLRRPAQIDLMAITRALDRIDGPRRTALNDRYRRLSQAVGIYNAATKTLDHDR